MMGNLHTLDYVSLIARASLTNEKSLWYPEEEVSMLQFALNNKATLVHYMLHAKHGKIERKADKLNKLLGEDFDEIVRKAGNFI
jgi:hypothetical protein